ncbi:MAG: hypothetical protein EOO43_14310, partial [Flavobacterium sp.]
MRLPIRNETFFALFNASILVFFLEIGNIDVQKFFGPLNARWLEDFTPYYPGLDAIQTHEIFSPKITKQKKIVVIGASAIDSIGCDASWSHTDEIPNAHWSCSITNQMNSALKDEGISNWKVFNLARNGARLTPMIYTYLQLLNINPDIVIYGDTYPYYITDNGGATDLKPEHYSYLENISKENPETAKLWADYYAQLLKNGLRINKPSTQEIKTPFEEIFREKITLIDILAAGLRTVKNFKFADGADFKISIRPLTINPAMDDFKFDDRGLVYFKGIELIAKFQKLNGKKFLFYFSPNAEHRLSTKRNLELDRIYGSIADQDQFKYLNLTTLPLELGKETY